MICFSCGKSPEEIGEYITAGLENDLDPKDYVRFEEATYNPVTDHFCCTDCYIQIGMPTSPHGWKAP